MCVKIAGFREDFEAERKDREELVATFEEFKARASLQDRDWQEKVSRIVSYWRTLFAITFSLAMRI